MKLTTGSIMLGGSVAAVVTAVVAGLFVLGSPSEERARRVDRRRVADLQAIAAATDLFWTRQARLPASLDELAAEPGVSISAREPAGSEAYGYQPRDSIRYELCANFERETEATLRDPARNLWAHGSGRQCFQLEAEKVERNEAGRTPAPEVGRDPDPATRRPR